MAHLDTHLFSVSNSLILELASSRSLESATSFWSSTSPSRTFSILFSCCSRIRRSLQRDGYAATWQKLWRNNTKHTVSTRGGVLEDVLALEASSPRKLPWQHYFWTVKISLENARNLAENLQRPFFWFPQVEISRRKIFEDLFFFFGEHLRLCPWPRNLFVSLGSSLVSSTPPLVSTTTKIALSPMSTRRGKGEVVGTRHENDSEKSETSVYTRAIVSIQPVCLFILTSFALVKWYTRCLKT